ncbi:hypothetical protein [Rhodoferax ferrireducens]|uniref:hypothetical protein n=1 Tax=Rhodoferax ferrireducens TaxID=192843 RepID=UPI000E0D73F4|nr:hypothetical protein [Rhodoferax ferrireducens]
MNNNASDFISLSIFIAALIFSQEAAAIVGPYVAIIAAASIGASFALARRDKATRTGAAVFFARVVGLAVLLTVVLAQIASAYYPAIHERLMLIPIALLVGFIGDEWPRLLDKVLAKLLGLIDFFRKGQP